MSFSHLLHDSPVFFISFCSFVGLAVGSFLNVVILRFPKMMERAWVAQCSEFFGETVEPQPPYNIVTPRSACMHCGHKLKAIENIPLVSYLLLKGRCASCRAAISPRYPLVELLTAVISGLIAWRFGFGLTTFAALAFTWSLIVLAFIDIDIQLLPNDITIPLLWSGLLVNLNETFTDIRSAVLGTVAGYAALWSIYWCFKLATRREGIGYGDFKLLAAIGAWLGWQMLPLVVLVSSVAGTLVGVGLIMVAKRGRHAPIPFGPYLAVGGLIALFSGDWLNSRYWNLI
ncbi:MAG TPA: A24 family peptidase [Nitrosospira sp.]|nr:A24 family peptidase [Nitrosospira sp.]